MIHPKFLLSAAGLAAALGVLPSFAPPSRACASAVCRPAREAVPMLFGRVLDRNGEPVPGARVFAVPIEESETAARPRADVESDKHGRFEIPDLPPGRYVLVALHGHHSPGRSGPVAIDDNPLPVSLKLVLDGQIESV